MNAASTEAGSGSPAAALTGGERPPQSFLNHHAEARIEEKAVLSARSRMHPTWIAKQLVSENDRLRANALEAAWGTKSDAAIRIFRSCITDKNYRVAGNALIGLHRAGCPETTEQALAMSESPDSRLRTTATWAMGKIGSAVFIDRLTALVKDEHRHVRSTAIKSLLAIRSKRRDVPEAFGRTGGPVAAQAPVSQTAIPQAAVPDPPAVPDDPPKEPANTPNAA